MTATTNGLPAATGAAASVVGQAVARSAVTPEAGGSMRKSTAASGRWTTTVTLIDVEIRHPRSRRE